MKQYFGGQIDTRVSSTTIARLDGLTFTWTKVGDLNQGRHAHSVIEVQGEILVIGGDGQKMSELCSYQNGQMTCVAQEPDLYRYAFFPELIDVHDDFCKNSLK